MAFRSLCRKWKAERAKAETALSVFLDLVGRHLQDWSRNVRSWVTEQPEITKKLGVRLSELKKEVEPTFERFPEMVRQWLGGDQLWRHRPAYKDEPKRYYQNDCSAYGNTGPKQISELLDGRLGFFGKEFAKRYGYDDVHHAGLAWKDIKPSLDEYAKAYEAFALAKSARRTRGPPA